jgi:uncharacterized protein YjgD (DUF1641 family)
MSETNKNETAAVIGQLDINEIKTLRDLLNTFQIIQDYLNDQVVKDICAVASNFFKLASAASGTDLILVLERALQDPNLDKALLKPPQPGMFSLMASLNNKDMKRGMGIIIELLKAMGRAAEEK